MIALLFLVIQIVVLFIAVTRLSENYKVYYMISQLLALVSMIYIINDKTNTSFKVAWMIPVLALPVFGTLMYIFVKLELGTKLLNHKLLQLIEKTKPLMPQDPEVMIELGKEDSSEQNFSQYMNDHAFFPTYNNTYTKFFPLGEDKYEAMMFEMEKAEKFIFMEYFIVEEGYMWNSILDLLKRKVKEGVEVRFMYDGTCSIALLPYNYPQKLAKYGIKCKVFSPIKPVLSTVQNNRDHRKITVIDGKVGFTGGYNLANEYFNYTNPYGQWKDTGIRLEGEAVRSLTITFLEMWNAVSEKDKNDTDFSQFLVQNDYQAKQNGFVQPYADIPMDDEQVGEEVYISMADKAEKYCWFMTPYLIITDEMSHALCLAAKRGVDVRIITPGIPDKRVVYSLTRSYYEPLIRAGVRIYEYTPGFIHAKSYLVDDKIGVVGTINMDYRSLFLHFEDGVWLCEAPCIPDIRRDFEQTVAVSQKVELRQYRHLSPIVSMYRSFLRIFAPLM